VGIEPWPRVSRSAMGSEAAGGFGHVEQRRRGANLAVQFSRSWGNRCPCELHRGAGPKGLRRAGHMSDWGSPFSLLVALRAKSS
jgi:hypothetical protein